MDNEAADKFELRNDAPKQAAWKPESVQRSRQMPLFIGLNDLPGQTYLIPDSNLKDD